MPMPLRLRTWCALAVSAVALGQAQERLTLAEAISTALRSNPELAVVRQDVALASGRFWKEVSPPAPTLTLTREYIPAGKSFSKYQEQSIALNQEIEFPVSWYLKGKVLHETRRQAEAQEQLSTVSLIARVKVAYFAARGSLDKLALAEENVAVAKDFADRAEIRFKSGEATRLEHLTARVQLGQAQQDLARARREERGTRTELLFLLGRRAAPGDSASLTLDTLRHEPLVGSLDLYFRRSDGENPLLRLQRSKQTAASGSAAIAWWNLLPGLTFSYLWQSRDGNSGYYGVGLGVSLPLWALFDHRGRIEEAAAAKRASEYELQHTENRVAVEIEQSWLALKENEHRLELFLRELRQQTEEVYRTAQVSFRSGEIMYLEYLQARQLLLQSRTQYIDALVQVNVSKAKLEAAAGVSSKE